MATKSTEVLRSMASISVGRTVLRKSLFRLQCLHTTASKSAIPLPITTPGPAPEPPLPAVTQHEDRMARRQKQAAMLQQGKQIRAAEKKPSGALRKRFWKDVHVREAPEGLQIHLDSRPVKTPDKDILTIPHTKPHLAAAIALEWDLLVTGQQALKLHLIPLTSLTTRAENIRKQDRRGESKTRKDIVNMVMRYLDTDTLLCWAPEHPTTSQVLEMEVDSDGRKRESLRDVQIKTAQPIISYLSTHIWPGAEIYPATDEDSIIPRSQPQMTKDIIRGWTSGLPAYELAGLERAVLAGKGLLAAVRLLVEWSPAYRHLRPEENKVDLKRFGVEEAAHAASLEVAWQTGVWGEVEDTHDVEKEDLRRQLGSVILLVADQEA